MAKEFAIITKPTGVTNAGTITKISKKKTSNVTRSHDEDGNVDDDNINQIQYVVEYEIEVDTRGSLPDVGDSIAVNFTDGDGELTYTVSDVSIDEQNSGEPNTATGTMYYDVPS